MWTNFHTHSNYCDGKGELSDHVTKAITNGMMSLGFSSHAPLPFACKWCMRTEKLNNYLDAIEDLKNTNPPVDIYKGLEVDFIPGVISPEQFKNKLDYTIGSVHFVERLPDGTPWEIDGLHTLFLEGYEKIFHNNIKDTITRYFELTREMITTACPTVIGHLDKIKIQNIEDKLFNEQDLWYRHEVEKTLALIRESGAIVEVNTRGIYQKKSSTTYPSPWIVEIIRQKNIPITLSSDAHHPDDLINQFPETARTLSMLGLKKLTILHEGSWKQYAYNEHGITPS